VALDQRHVLGEVELDAVHPGGVEAVDAPERRRGTHHLGSDKLWRGLDGHREHELVGPECGAIREYRAGDPLPVEGQSVDGRVRPEVDTQRVEIPHPGVNPGLAGRPVQDALGRSRRVDLPQQQLEEDGADSSGAADLRAERDQRLRDVGKPVTQCLRAVVRVDELPPRDPVEFLLAALLAGSEQVQQAFEHEPNVAPWQVVGEHRLECLEPAGYRLRGPCLRNLVRLVGLRDERLAGDDEVVLDGAVAVWNPCHRVDDVVVKGRKKAEPVLALERGFVVDGNRAGLAAKAAVCLADRHVDVALGEFLRDREPADAAADYENV